MSDVKLLAAWDGWCDPCASERPLVLVEIGPRGLRSWLHGVGSEDRTLSLTCRVCGQWQLVPQLEEDDEPVEAVAEAPVTAGSATAESSPDTVISPVLASALIPVRTAAFDETGRVVASTPVAESVARPRTEVLLAEEPPAEEASAPRSRWFSRKPAADTSDEETPAVEAIEDVPVAETAEPPAPRTRWFSRKAAVDTSDEETPAEETPAVEALAVEPAAHEQAEPAAPRARWFTRRTTAEAVVTATTVTPAVAPRPVPRSIAPDVEEPVRPHKVNPAAVRPLPQTRAIPVPRTYRAPISAPSATDTSPLALLAAGYDVVAAGTR